LMLLEGTVEYGSIPDSTSSERRHVRTLNLILVSLRPQERTDGGR